MPQRFLIRKAARIVDAGGVVACPTEGVFGLSCLPDDPHAVARILDIKQRDPDLGLILIGATPDHLAPWVDSPDPRLWNDSHAITWIMPASPATPGWVRGKHPGVAVRLTSHPVAAALCQACDSALISTSANVSGRPPATNRFVLQRQFQNRVDFIVPGDCGSASGPSEIRDLQTGAVLRAGSK